MIRIVYSSRATTPFGPEELLALLEVSRVHNERRGVSGMLLHADGTFIQTLEGDPDVVERLYSKIESDPRHEDAQVLLREEIEERGFGQWTMGFVAATPELVQSIEGLNGFLQSSSTSPLNEAESAERVRKVLEQFKAGRWRREIEG